ncbi:MAG: xanthine dehydrogenase small subunit [Sneathiellaceae bacterium]
MPSLRHEIRFLLNETPVTVSEAAPDTTLLSFLRLERRLTGSKEGCAEGDCGACTVMVGRLAGGELVYEAVTSCIRLLPSLDGCHVVTVEHLSRDGGLHPIQQALVDAHGSQCGFCTPGIAMALYALWLRSPAPGVTEIERALQGNLCRCTGYQPIVDAALSLPRYGTPDADPLAMGRAAVQQQLAAWQDGARVELAHGDARAILPADGDDFAAALADNAGATIVAGATDVGLWVTKRFQAISPAIFIGHLAGLQQVEAEEAGLRLGAGISYAQALPHLLDRFPHLAELWWRIGGDQIRSMGTIGGNIANGSPIGDTPPAFIALAATLTLRSRRGARTLPLEDFFIAYGRQDRGADEFVESVFLPYPEPGRHDAAYKLSKRRDEDISAVCGAFSLRLEGETVAALRIAYGGMAATPRRAAAVEAALLGRPWSAASLAGAATAFDADFQPIGDWRASADYRRTAARNLLRRFHLQTTGMAGLRLSRETAA